MRRPGNGTGRRSIAESGDPPASFQALIPAIEATRGWFSRESAALWDCLLHRQRGADVRGPLMEIGVWHGRAAILLAAHARQQGDESDSVVLVDINPKAAAIAQAMRRAFGDGPLPPVHLLQEDSHDLPHRPAARAHAHRLRWIHIDGEHSAAAATADLDTAHLLLAPNGVVVLDDILHPWYPQLTAALFRYLTDHPGRFSLFMLGFGKAYLCRHRLGAWYRSYVLQHLPEDMAARGVPVTLVKTTDASELDCWSVVPQFDGLRVRGPDWAPDSIEAVTTYRGPRAAEPPQG